MTAKIRTWLVIVTALLLGGAPALAAGEAPPPAPPMAPLPAECRAADAEITTTAPLPAIVKALSERKKVIALAIGGTAVGAGGRSGDYYALVESFLEATFKGLDVVIVQRGVSGELARDAAERIKLETARNQPDVVFWQVGTADALAGVDPEEFAATLRDTIHWLREHDVDTILIGLHYSRALARDPHYQAVRAAVVSVAKSENVLRVSRYEVMETLSKLQQKRTLPETETELTATGYNCMAEYLARALATGIFGRARTTPPARPAERR
jgi:lysophospholipase L1-like esterase